jgi:hypothetical protein
MNSAYLATCVLIAILSIASAEPTPGDAAKPKSTPAPQAAPGTKPSAVKKPKAAPKPQPSRKDVALKEVRSCDRDNNSRIDGLEVMTLNNLLKSNPDSFLYLFDEDGNHSFDSTEIAAINKLLKPKKK